MKSYPAPGDYVAFSLKVAQARIAGLEKGKNYRTVYPVAYNLGGINKIFGLVYDRGNRDTILIGKYDPKCQPITLDDFVVALKARFIHGQWPMVSLDPTEDSPQTGRQNVRFEGGIENTQFGADLLDADHRLKRMTMGYLRMGVPGLKSIWELDKERRNGNPDQRGQSNISSRFWFYPVLHSVSVRQDVVAIKGLQVGVFTEILSAEIDGKVIEDLSSFTDETSETFAQMVSNSFDDLAQVHPSFSRVQGLDELVALTKAMEDMEEKPNLDWWLERYTVKEVPIPQQLKFLKREEKYKVSTNDGYIVRGRRTSSGGVQLMALALRLKSGDVTALKEAVLKTRISLDALSWGFVVGEWIIPTSGEMVSLENIVPLFTQAVFLQRNKRYDAAITLYEKIISLKPDWEWAYNNRGVAYVSKGDGDRALADYTRALELNPKDAEAYYNRGVAYNSKGDEARALADYTRALELKPKFAEAYTNRGATYLNKGDEARALADYTRAIELNPKDAEAYYNRGAAYNSKGAWDRALADFTRALELKPKFVEAYTMRGVAYNRMKDWPRALADFTQALEFNPQHANAYANRGVTYAWKGDWDRALADFTRALELNPQHANAYFNRGVAYDRMKDWNRALADFTRAIELKPKSAEAYTNRGATYLNKGDEARALADFTRAIELNPKDEEVYYKRGMIYFGKGDGDQALADFTRALELNPRNFEANDSIGLIFGEKGNQEKGCYYLKQACRYGKCRSFNMLKQKGYC
ncbi:tetratricopeptide repeat protein [Nitrospira sp. Ecomares 2.1]